MSFITKEHCNFLKLIILVRKYGTKVLREKVRKELSKDNRTFQDLLKASRHDIIHLYVEKRCCECTFYPTTRPHVISQEQLTLLFDVDKRKTCTRQNKDRDQYCSCRFKEKENISEKDLDITLLSCFLTNIIKHVTDRRLVGNLRNERNRLFHTELIQFPTDEFENRFQDIAHIINEIAKGFDAELFEKLRNQMIELESSECSPQPVPSALELDVKHLETEDAQTNTAEQISDTKATGMEFLCNLDLDDVRGFPETLRKQLKAILDQLDPPTEEETLRKETMVSSTLTSALRSEIEMTSMTLDEHVSPENVFQATQQLHDAFHLLDTKHVLVLCGIAGSGKTTLAHEVLYHMREEYTPIILSNPDQLKRINPRDKVLVFLDDILGRSAYSEDSARIWYNVFDTMYILSRQGAPRFILAFRENVYEDFRQDTDEFHDKLLCDEHLVNVSCMESLEREAMLKKYCSNNGVSLYYGIGCVSVNKSSKSLDRTTFKQICNFQPLTGFPHSCFLFFSNDIFFEMGHEFFVRPGQSLISKVDKFRKSKDVQCRLQYAVLAYMMLVDEAVDLSTLATNADFKQVTDDLNLKEITDSKLLDCVREDNVRSLVLDEKEQQNKVVFRHQTIKEAVFMSFSEHFPDRILQKSKLQLIKDFFRSKSYVRKTGEVIVTLQTRCYTTLSTRLIDEILQNNNCSQCVGLQVFEDSGFTKDFVDALLATLKDMEDANDIVKRLLLCSSEHGKHVLLSELLQVCIVYDDDHYKQHTTNDVDISMTYFREEILSTAIRKGHVKAISSIVKKERSVLYRSKCGLLPIHTAIWTGIRPVCDILWDEYGTETTCMSSFNDASGRRCIHYCAMRGYIDKIREIKSHGDEFVMTTDARNQSALHYAAYGGQYHILHELIGYGLSIGERTKDEYSVLQVLLISLDYDERCKILPQIPQDILRAISSDNSVLWNNDYYRALEYILELSDTDLNDLDLIIHKTHKYNVAHYACIDDAGVVVSLLLNKRRALFLKRNATSLPMAWDIAAFLGRCSILKTLLESGLVNDSDISSLVQTAEQGRKQAHLIKFMDRRLLLNRHEREKIWPGCCFPFVIFGQECDYDDIEKLLK